MVGHKVYHVTPSNWHPDPNRNYNYKVIKFGFRGYGRLKLVTASALLTLAYVVNRFQIDVINVHNVSTPGSWAFFYKKFFRHVPVIGTPHGDDIQSFPDIGWGVRLSPEQDRIVQRNLRSFSRVVAISPSILDELLKIGVKKENIETIPNGIWTRNYGKKIDITGIRRKFCIPLSSIALISVGRNHPVKGFQYVLNAIKNLINSGFEVSYILVGRDMDSIREKAESLSISDHLITPGEVSNKIVSELLEASDIFISSSFVESFGLTTLEAMCSGLPCVVSNVAGSKDLVSSEYGIIYEVGNIGELTNAISYLITHPSLREKMGANACIEAQAYDWEIIAKKYEDVYNQTLLCAGEAASGAD
jgi:glycosyltransferase involved in cell wall biosynthesis